MTRDTESIAFETLASAINRTAGLLNAVGDLYSPKTDSFSGGNAFTAHAVATAQGLLADATKAMTDLYEAMDERAAAAEADRQVLEDALAAAHAQVAVQVTDIGGDIDQTMLAEHGSVIDHNVELRENFVESYTELLRKVTAVEVFAAGEVLPLVQDLREQLEKLNNVA